MLALQAGSEHLPTSELASPPAATLRNKLTQLTGIVPTPLYRNLVVK